VAPRAWHENREVNGTFCGERGQPIIVHPHRAPGKLLISAAHISLSLVCELSGRVHTWSVRFWPGRV